MKKRFLILSLSLCISILGHNASAGGENLAIKKAAKSFALLLDNGEYEKSWEELAPDAKMKLSKEVWVNEWLRLRKGLGRLKERQLVYSGFEKTSSGRKDKQKARVQFASAFENYHGVGVIEEFMLTREKEGDWQVVAYICHPVARL